MASAEKSYVDPSALRSLYLHDARSRGFCAWAVRARGSLSLTAHGRAEIVNSIELAVFRRDITQAMAESALGDLAVDLAEGRISLVDAPWRRVLDRAEALSRSHTSRLGTRTLDVVHVATAVELGKKIFVTYDDRQAALADAEGLRVVRP